MYFVYIVLSCIQVVDMLGILEMRANMYRRCMKCLFVTNKLQMIVLCCTARGNIHFFSFHSCKGSPCADMLKNSLYTHRSG